MRVLTGLLLTLFVPSLALGQAVGKSAPTKVLVWYDQTTGVVIEAVIPDSDAEGAKYFSAAAHPVTNGARVELAVSAIKSKGFVGALTQVAPAAVAVAPPVPGSAGNQAATDRLRSLRMLGDQVETMLAENAAKAALR